MSLWKKAKEVTKIIFYIFLFFVVSYFVSEAFIALHSLANKWSHLELHAMFFAISMASIYSIFWIALKFNEIKQRLNDELMEDSLTNLKNSKFLRKSATAQIKSASRHGDWACVCFFDLNKFKSINEAFGHKGGDNALKCFAKKLTQIAHRSGDIVVRLHGDEFLVFWVSDSQEKAIGFYETAKNKTATIDFFYKENLIEFSASVGFASMQVGTEIDTEKILDYLVDTADQAMFEHKKGQR